jgi:hypothetical protein
MPCAGWIGKYTALACACLALAWCDPTPASAQDPDDSQYSSSSLDVRDRPLPNVAPYRGPRHRRVSSRNRWADDAGSNPSTSSRARRAHRLSDDVPYPVRQASGVDPIFEDYPETSPPVVDYGDPSIDSDMLAPPYADGNDCHPGCGWRRGPIYVGGEYLLWWVKGDAIPPLVTTSPQGTAQAQAGVLGQPGTSVLLGNQDVNLGSRSGVRVVLGGWITPMTRIEGSYFRLVQSAQNYNQTSAGDPILARPYFDLDPASGSFGLQNANLIGFPGVFSGSINFRATSNFQGADLHIAHNLSFAEFGPNRQHRVDFLAGYRFLQLHENLSLNANITNIGAAVQIATSDSFGASNNFNGAELGLFDFLRLGRWTLETTGRVGLGITSESVSIGGSNSTANPIGGLLTQPSNIGSFQHNGFAVVPELGLKLGFDVTPRLRVNVGYDLIYWSRVARPGSQIDTTLNLSQASGGILTGVARPAFAFNQSDLWVQGISMGGEFRF